jgi:hypothetical protein
MKLIVIINGELSKIKKEYINEIIQEKNCKNISVKN